MIRVSASKVLSTIGLALILSAPAMADTYSDLKTETDKLIAMDNGAAKFISIFRKAQLGDPESQVLAGVIYQSGKIVPQNYEKAKEWYQLAADQDDAKGQYMMGYVYDIGIGVKRNKEKAFSWFKQSAEQGDSWAMLTMSRAHYKGFGAVKDYKKSLEWAKKGAESNHAESQLLLALYYNDSKMALADTDKAILWAKKSCENGLTVACDHLDTLTHTIDKP